MQSDWIRQNCAVQMERVRENYNWQVQNLRDIRHYGSNQVGAVRDQYFEQVNMIKVQKTGLFLLEDGFLPGNSAAEA